MFGEANRRLAAEDSLTLANGVIGAYPNVFLDLSEADRSRSPPVCSITAVTTIGEPRDECLKQRT